MVNKIDILTHKGCRCGASLHAQGCRTKPSGMYGRYWSSEINRWFYARLICIGCGALYEIDLERYAGEFNEIKNKVHK